MTSQFDNLLTLGILVQASGAALIGGMCLLLNRSVHRPGMRAWTRGWFSLAASLVALLGAQAYPASAVVTLPLHLFAQYLFGYWLVVGCMRFACRYTPRHLIEWVVPTAAFVAVAMPNLAQFDLRLVFMVQSTLLAAIFSGALYALSPAWQLSPNSTGLLTMRVSLAMLVVAFGYYVPIFAASLIRVEPLPTMLLHIGWAGQLVFEFALGYGGAVLVLEHSHSHLLDSNRNLRADLNRFRSESQHDVLTGAYNRRAFFALMDALQDHADVATGCIALIDLDDMKKINDTRGHEGGDAALQRVAHVVRQLVRADDRLIRWGGDEFLLIALGLDAADLSVRLDSLNARLRSVEAGDVAVSYGLATFVGPDEMMEAIQRADAAMYTQKRARSVQRWRSGVDGFLPQKLRRRRTA